MSRQTLCALLVLAAVPAAAVEVRSYEVALQVAADGGATANAEVRLGDAAPGEVVVPLGFAAAEELHLVDAPAGTTLRTTPLNGQTMVRLGLAEGVPPEVTVRFAFAARDVLRRPPVKAGEAAHSGSDRRRILRHALLNPREEAIGRYRFAAALPGGMRAHAVREWLPKLRPREAGPRVQLGDVAGMPGVRLEVNTLVQGETAAVQVELVPRSLPIAWLLAGAILSLLYLYRFRDLVTRPRR